jgi:hypothetical protein
MGKKKNNKNSGTQLVTLPPERYPALAGDVSAAIAENLGGEDIGPSDLTRIKVPAGGGQNWTIPGIDGTDESLPALEGIIVHVERRRAFWPDPTPSGEFPACVSADWLRGEGEPGGECADCPYNQWGSAQKPDGGAGRGKACKQMRLVFLLREGQVLPEVVIVSPGSLQPVKNYLLKLAPLKICDVVTRLELVQTKNKDGIAYSQIKPVRVAQLDPASAAKARDCANELRAVFQATTVRSEEVNGESNDGER